MLRLWRERVLVSAAPDALTWVRLHRGLRPAVYEKRVVAVDPAFGHEPWQGVAAALRTQAERWRNEPVDVGIVLSNQFVRYALVPHADSVGSDEEKLALARFHFNKLHGEASQAWDVRLSPAPGHAAQVASAVDTGLMSALRGCFPQNARARLVSVQPWLMAAYNAARGQLSRDGAWLLLIEADRTCAALIGPKAILAVRNIKGHFADPASWRDLIEREQLRIEQVLSPRLILVGSAINMAMPSQPIGACRAAAVAMNWPQGTDAQRDGAYRPALSLL